MRKLLLAVAMGAVASLASADPPRPPKTNHPILGTWIFAVPDTDCEETYYMRQDGTTLVTSGQEVAESVYEIADEPSANGFYKSIDRIVKDNGKPDCAGGITKVGAEVTNYIRFHPSSNMMIICKDESLKACFGPLFRLGGEAS
ncbi:MAG TPA: hypothetical protein VH183_03415 [Burkholderiaceae bacterium]|nr:hypothetical protein [Burkholderiaceae bacterium]